MMVLAWLQRHLGRKRALELLLTGDRLKAEEALAWGLVNRVVPRAELDGGHPRARRPRRREEPGRPRARQGAPSGAPRTCRCRRRWTSSPGSSRSTSGRRTPPRASRPSSSAGPRLEGSLAMALRAGPGHRHRRAHRRARQPRAVPVPALHPGGDRRGGAAGVRGRRGGGAHPRPRARRRPDLVAGHLRGDQARGAGALADHRQLLHRRLQHGRRERGGEERAADLRLEDAAGDGGAQHGVDELRQVLRDAEGVRLRHGVPQSRSATSSSPRRRCARAG